MFAYNADMAIYQLIEERIISGLGTIRLPEEQSVLDSRVLILLCEAIRPATNRFINNEWFPPRELYARMVFRRAGVVLKSAKMEFPDQMWLDYADMGGQALIAVQCAYKGILQTFFNLGNALNLPSISIQNDIADYTRLHPAWDEVVFNCYADSAIRASLYSLPYENCGTDSGLSQTPFIPPTPPVQVPPGEPIEVSEPYQPGEVNEPYSPAPIDIVPEPPEPELEGNQCQRWKLFIDRRVNGISQGVSEPLIWAEFIRSVELRVGGQVVSNPYTAPVDPPSASYNFTFWVECRGGQFDSCGEFRKVAMPFNFVISPGDTISADIINAIVW